MPSINSVEKPILGCLMAGHCDNLPNIYWSMFSKHVKLTLFLLVQLRQCSLVFFLFVFCAKTLKNILWSEKCDNSAISIACAIH